MTINKQETVHAKKHELSATYSLVENFTRIYLSENKSVKLSMLVVCYFVFLQILVV